jgi:2,3-dihydroxyphenylpropionate 1,2-dioxygenase
MGNVVGAISMSHAPGATGWPDAPQKSMKQRLDAAHARLAHYLAEVRPDVIIAFLDDHFENLFRSLMPTFAIGIAPSHSGPADHMIKALLLDKKETLPGEPALAQSLLQELVRAGFDVARMGEVEYGNNLMVPLKLIRPQFDIPVVPIFINVFSPPLTSTARAYAFGASVRAIVDKLSCERRIAFLATGGLSHWPPIWLETSPEDDAFLQRMKRYQTEGRAVLKDDPDLYTDLARYEIEMAAKNQFPLNCQHPLVNADWDREFLSALGRGDIEYMRALTYDEVEAKGGHGAHEILNWIAVMGAMGGAPARIVAYEPVIEWICGMGYALYDI